MLRNYLKVALRNLRRHPLHAAINVVGLALGLAVCVLLLQYLRHELSYDRFHEKSDRLYRVLYEVQEEHARTPPPLAKVLRETAPEIRTTVRLEEEPGVVGHGEDLFETTVTFADSTFFEVFTVPLAYGDPETALQRPESAVLSTSAAKRYFGQTNVVGRSLSIRMGTTFDEAVVTGVAAPQPTNSSIQFDVLLPRVLRTRRCSPIQTGGRSLHRST